MSLTKKHFIKAAKSLKEQFTGHPCNAKHWGAFWQARENFVQFFASENPRFDSCRFRNACMPDAADWQKKRATEGQF